MHNCIFCKIINKKIKSTIVYEDDEIIAFHDLFPKADIHILIIPKLHIESMLTLDSSHIHLMGQLMVKTNQIAVNLGLDGYKININNGEKGGQEIPHLHLHLLANK